ncbi:GDSL-type esterase/lipase family protein [Gimesia aquarii]|uniref:Acetylxylan esterase n=1 Tax=Gimesia aquarii TaxID=2527964 RepID=A0A517WYQ8_9PLAN|nr:GDSL-type esterase/lipase family protein [Gimesia aquarii]QDU10396.1 Acetylxylan esterase precursor [Gimesia aquarii]
MKRHPLISKRPLIQSNSTNEIVKKLIINVLSTGFFILSSAATLSATDPKPEWKYEAKLLKPFWQGDTIEGESLLFIRDPKTGEANASVLFPMKKVLKISNSTGDITYEEGKDYLWNPGQREIRLPKNSRINSQTPDDLRRPAGTQKYKLTHRDGNGEIFFGGKLEYHNMQTCITYTHDPIDWKGIVPHFNEKALSRTIQKLRDRQPVSIVVIGDSISAGCNASGWAGEAPFQPSYPGLLEKNLSEQFQTKVRVTNPSVSGKDTRWVLSAIDKVVEPDPDLVIIAFGMNDSAGRSAKDYQSNTKAVIEKIREKRPQAEFILVASMLGNKDWIRLKHELFPQYREALAELCQPGIALADMTSIWTEFLKRKQDWDLTGNGVNHPNDFGHRVYAQVISTLLVPPESSTPETKTSHQPKAIPLWKDRAPIGNDQFEKSGAKITVHQPVNGNGAAIIICPGGGYGGLVTGAEGHGIAKWLNRQGITGVVLEYRLPAGRPFVPLLDAQQAIRMVRANAKNWNIDPARVGIMGFSAGGHLASTAGTHFDSGNPQAAQLVDRESSRPDFVILVYPVVTMGEHTHKGSRKNLLGLDPSPQLIELFSNERQVTAQTPPMFLAHALDDKPVPPKNSQMLFQMLQTKKVPSKYLELPSGGHGLNGYKGPMWDAWQTQSLDWLAKLKFIPTQKSQN